MRKRWLAVPIIGSLGILFLLGFLWERSFLYAGLFLGMVFMHLFGHGHHHKSATN